MNVNYWEQLKARSISKKCRSRSNWFSKLEQLNGTFMFVYMTVYGLNFFSKYRFITILNRVFLYSGLMFTIGYVSVLPFTMRLRYFSLAIVFIFLSLMRIFAMGYAAAREKLLANILKQVFYFNGNSLKLVRRSIWLFEMYLILSMVNIGLIFYFNWSDNLVIAMIYNWVRDRFHLSLIFLRWIDLLFVWNLKQSVTFASTSYICAFVSIRQAIYNLHAHLDRFLGNNPNQSHVSTEFAIFWSQCERYIKLRQQVQLVCGPMIFIFYIGLFLATSVYFLTAITLQPSVVEILNFLILYLFNFMLPIFYSTFLIGSIRSRQQHMQRRLYEIVNPINPAGSLVLLSQTQRLAYLQLIQYEIDEPVTAWGFFSINRALPFHFFNTNASFIMILYNIVGEELSELLVGRDLDKFFFS